MNKSIPIVPDGTVLSNDLLGRIVTILEDARQRVVRSVNSQMVLAYWLIGREIVQALQGGGERASYGQGLLEGLSNELTQRFGRGFSATNLKNCRLFYQAYQNHLPEIRQMASDELNQNVFWAGLSC